jgi:hypothetical protein
LASAHLLFVHSILARGCVYYFGVGSAKRNLDNIIIDEQAKGVRIQVEIAEGPSEKEVFRSVKENKIDLLIRIGKGISRQFCESRRNREPPFRNED